MTDARARGWGWPGAPGSAEERAYRRDHIVTVQAAGINLLVRREAAPLFAGFINECFVNGYDFDDVADDWGWANRDIRGRPGVKSNHAWGLGIDANATKNPMGDKLVTDMPDWMVTLGEKKYGLTWGGHYSGRKDAMHWEFTGTLAQCAALVARLNGAPQPPPQPNDPNLPKEKDVAILVQFKGKPPAQVTSPPDPNAQWTLAGRLLSRIKDLDERRDLARVGAIASQTPVILDFDDPDAEDRAFAIRAAGFPRL